MTMATTGPSQRALNQACKIAREAAKQDNWMEPVPEEHDEEDYGDFVESHRGRWEQTCHFEHFYRERLIDLADKQAARFNVFQTEDWEGWYYGFVQPIKEAFWEEWEEKVNLADKWNAHHKGEDAIANFDDLDIGDKFRIGNGTNVYQKTSDGEYKNVKTGALHVGRERQVHPVR